MTAGGATTPSPPAPVSFLLSEIISEADVRVREGMLFFCSGVLTDLIFGQGVLADLIYLLRVTDRRELFAKGY
jgi:hypothetical protein